MEAMKLTPEQLLQIENHMTSKFRIVEHQVLTDSKFEQHLLRIDHQHELMERGFEQIDKRFEEQVAESNRRFDQVDKRFDRVHFFMQWQTGLGFLMVAGIYLKLFLG